MKLKVFLYVFITWFFVACTTKIVEEVIESYPDGSPKVVRFYKDDGSSRVLFKETLYYSNHQKYMEGEYKNGKRNGKWTSWFENGKKWSEGNYKEGIDNGKHTVYFDNGKKYFEGNYKDGKKTGTWSFWNKDGKLINKEDYNK